MAQPWQTIESVPTPEGDLELRQRGQRDFLITVGGRVLMSSMTQRSEVILGQIACDGLQTADDPKVLVGGLGMGITLRAILDALPATARVVVAELNPVVLEWCRGPLAALTDNAVRDSRVEVEVDDVAHLIRRFATASPTTVDAVVLDLYSGPYTASHKGDDPVFGIGALTAIRKSLKPNGVLAVWGEDYDAGFDKRMAQVGFTTRLHRSGRGGVRHVVYLGRTAAGGKQP